MLQEISFGYYYFQIAMMFRNSMLLNGMLCSSEVLYGITNEHIEMLEKCDRTFMRRVFDCPVRTPIESFYLETYTYNCNQIYFDGKKADIPLDSSPEK